MGIHLVNSTLAILNLVEGEVQSLHPERVSGFKPRGFSPLGEIPGASVMFIK